MVKVYIPGPYNIPITRQFKTEELVWGNTQFVFDANEDYDCIAVVDGISVPIVTTSPKENRFFWTGEPPMVKRYTKSFLSQFAHIFSCQKNLVANSHACISNPPLPWMVGCSLKQGTHFSDGHDALNYQDFILGSFDDEKRIDKACVLTSNKTITKGHRDRVKFVEKILKDKVEYIDIYGNGYKSVGDKLEVLSKYKYSIVIENCQYPNYWTEKLSDCILAGCCPIYYGASNISDFFPINSFPVIDILNYQEAIAKVDGLIKSDYFSTYHKNIGILKSLILDKYNMFAMINDAIAAAGINMGNKLQEPEILHPMKYSILDRGLSRIHRMFNI